MIRDEQRKRIVEIARSWLGTPYHHQACLKGVGVDCAQLLVGVYQEFDPTVYANIPAYSPQWHLNRGEEKYLEVVRRHMTEIDGPPLPGDIAMWKFGRCFSHGAIVVAWPLVIHARVQANCELIDVGTSLWLKNIGTETRPVKFFQYGSEK
jgi:Cell wall-associated hydrolases (invasion-associated proteins)